MPGIESVCFPQSVSVRITAFIEGQVKEIKLPTSLSPRPPYLIAAEAGGPLYKCCVFHISLCTGPGDPRPLELSSLMLNLEACRWRRPENKVWESQGLGSWLKSQTLQLLILKPLSFVRCPNVVTVRIKRYSQGLGLPPARPCSVASLRRPPWPSPRIPHLSFLLIFSP